MEASPFSNSELSGICEMQAIRLEGHLEIIDVPGAEA
jgi:hypothetical protein